LTVSIPGVAFLGRRLREAMPFLGDDPSGQLVDLPSLLWGPRAVPPCVDFDFDFWSTPRDGTRLKSENNWLEEKINVLENDLDKLNVDFENLELILSKLLLQN